MNQYKLKSTVVFICLLACILIANGLISKWVVTNVLRGEYFYHPDGPMRLLTSYAMYHGSEIPRHSILFDFWLPGAYLFPNLLWLPFQYWAVTAVLAAGLNPLSAGMIVNTFFSSLAAVCICLIAREICGSKTAGLVAACVYLAQPIVTKLSLSSLDLPSLQFFLAAGLYLRIRAVGRDDCVKILILAGVCFFGATMVRYEGWIFAAIYLVSIRKYVFSRRLGPMAKALITVLPVSFMAFWALYSICESGTLKFVQYYRHQALSGGLQNYSQSIFDNLSLYVKELFGGSGVIVALGALGGIVPRANNQSARIYLGIIALYFLAISCSIIVIGMPLTPEKLTSTFYILLVPTAVRLLYGAVSAVPSKLIQFIVLAAFCGLYRLTCLQSLVSSLGDVKYRRTEMRDITEKILRENVIPEDMNIFFEQRIFSESDADQWGANYNIEVALSGGRRVIADRQSILRRREGRWITPWHIRKKSLLSGATEKSLAEFLRGEKVAAVICWSGPTTRIMDEIATKIWKGEHYNAYIISP